MPTTGIPMPPDSAGKKGSSSKAIENARDTALNSWNRHGNNTPTDAIANDKASIRKEIDPKSLGPSGE